MSEQEWYADGLRFECTMCGDCCTGAPGFVLFNDDEAQAIADRLDITVEEFLERYTHDTRAGRSLTEHSTEHGFDCVFLDRDSMPGKAICSLHDVRPTQCRTFPFWPEHLRSPHSWSEASQECEGIGQGELTPLVQIRIQRDKH
jgi:uncharacterized protein